MQANEQKPSLMNDLRQDLKYILHFENRSLTLKNLIWAIFACDAYAVLASFRLRQWSRRYHIPLLNRILRFLQTALYGIELGNGIHLGHGVYFVHTVGTVIGGDAWIGDRCIFMGCNTVGAAKFQGSPRIGDRTLVGAGARILGKIEVGSHCTLGANAVILQNIPSHQTAVGVPAKVVPSVGPREDIFMSA